MGIIFGVYGLNGIFVFIGFMALNLAFIYVYSFKFMEIDENKLELNDLYTESLMISVMNFILAWILSYTFLYLKNITPLNDNNSNILTPDL